MGLLDMFRSPDMNQGLEDFKAAEDGKLIDVRTREEYASGHIPESVNIPLHDIGRAQKKIPDKSTPIFVYCHSGARSIQAKSALTKMGYTSVTNLGGIGGYRGKVEK